MQTRRTGPAGPSTVQVIRPPRRCCRPRRAVCAPTTGRSGSAASGAPGSREAWPHPCLHLSTPRGAPEGLSRAERRPSGPAWPARRRCRSPPGPAPGPRPAPRPTDAEPPSCTARAAPALSSTASRTAPGSPSRTRTHHPGVVRRVATAQRLGGAERHPEVTRVDRGGGRPRPRGRSTRDDVVVVVSSSRPSSPRKTQASTPRCAKTPAITGAIRASAQPIAWAAGWPGWRAAPGS